MKNDYLMGVSAFLAVLFFGVANFTSIFTELNIVAGIMQITLNVFVFFTWLKGFRTSQGFKKFVAFWGVVVPIAMVIITLTRVVIPALT